ncbi:MAG: hypothetical protein KAS46_08775 [Candidatus Aureabacteria bacterium]|nr:hypothetical protein [Candidatus Auribacterota bacterium]
MGFIIKKSNLEKALAISMAASYLGASLNAYVIYFYSKGLTEFSFAGFLTSTLLGALATLYTIAFALYCGIFKLLSRWLTRPGDPKWVLIVMPAIVFLYSSTVVYFLWIVFCEPGQ